MKKPHKHAAVIKAWADGAEVQSRVSGGRWTDRLYPEWSEAHEYRVKPESLKYRRFLWVSPYSKQVLTVHEEEQKREPRETWVNFVRWIDTEWQEVEI